MQKKLLTIIICIMIFALCGCGLFSKSDSKKDKVSKPEKDTQHALEPETEAGTELEIGTEIVLETEMSTETNVQENSKPESAQSTVENDPASGQDVQKQETNQQKQETPKQETPKQEIPKQETTQPEPEAPKQEPSQPENTTQTETQTPVVTPQEPETPERGAYLVKGKNLSGASLSVGDAMYDMTITTVNGETVVLSEVLKEKDMVMLNFWATWCGPCMTEFPYMSEAYNAYKDDIEIIAFEVEASNSQATVEWYRKNYGWQFKVAQGSTSWVYTFNPNGTIPTSVIIDRYGIIRDIHVGYITSAEGFTSIFDRYIGDSYQP